MITANRPFWLNESDRLNEEKQKILVTLAEDKGRQEKKAELIDFPHEQTTEFEEFDDGLVRRLIEQIRDLRKRLEIIV